MDSVVRLRAYGTFLTQRPRRLVRNLFINFDKTKINIYLLASASVFTIFSVLLTQSRSAALSLHLVIFP